MLFSFILITFFFVLFSYPSLAVSDFTINENIEYLLTAFGQATVTHQVDIINNYSQIYPREYQLQIRGIPITDLSATDSQGNILVSSVTNEDNTSIQLKFNQAKVGQNQTTSFKLIYRIPDLAKHKGKTWEINLPESVNNSSGESQISLITPTDFGALSFSSLPAKFQDGLTQNTTTIHSSSRRKILLIFGNYQLFNFRLTYFLQNSDSQKISSEIAIIPDTYSQSVYYQSINPTPQSIRVDTDGNWLAKYQLDPGQSLNITATGQIKTGLHLPNSISNPNDYLLDQEFWPVSDSQIQSIADTLTNARSIYDYVVNHLNYNYDRLNSSGRLGAISALIDPNNSLCTEFTDLFVTLARAKSIPAREIEGFAYSNNPKIKPVSLQNDVLHAWPEYYDAATHSWKAIDPTWAKTTNGIDYFNDLDLNHIVFVTHGQNSSQPLPPGSYKENNQEKTIFIDFATEEIQNETSFPSLSFQKNNLLIQNHSPNSLKALTLSIPLLSYSQTLDSILPYSSSTISLPSVSFWQSLLPRYQKINITLEQADGESNTQTLNYPRHFIDLGISIVVALIILSISGIIITSQHHEKNS